MSKTIPIDRPIFILGAPRSGTTLLYNLLGSHPELAWFSNITSRLRALPQLAFFSRFYKYRQLMNLPPYLALFIPKPYEGYEFWESFRTKGDKYTDPKLDPSDLTAEEVAAARRMVEAHLKYQGGRRFINKNIGMSRRATYINAIFPDARFIHIIRDPRGTSASLLSWKHWNRVTFSDGHFPTPREWESQGNDPSELAASIWLHVNQVILKTGEPFGSRYIRIHYEDLAENPKEILAKLLDHCELEWSNEFEKLVDSFSIRNMNYLVHERLTNEQIETVERIAKPLSGRLGYDQRSAASA